MQRRYRRGDRVVYRKRKHSNRPGPRARDIEPEPNGEGYSYEVEKYWVVVQAMSNGMVCICTRRGKQRQIETADPNLRHAAWWERLIFSSRFPAPRTQLLGH